MAKKKEASTCLACTCPCEEHKVHNHPVEKEGNDCGPEPKEKGSCCGK